MNLNECIEYYDIWIFDYDKDEDVKVNVDWLSSKCWEYVNKYNLKDWTIESCKRFIYNNQQLVIDFFNAMDCIEVLYIEYVWECYFYYKCCNGYGEQHKTLNEIVQLDILNGREFRGSKLV